MEKIICKCEEDWEDEKIGVGNINPLLDKEGIKGRSFGILPQSYKGTRKTLLYQPCPLLK